MGILQSLRRIVAEIGNVAIKEIQTRSVNAKFVCHCIGGTFFYVTSEMDDVEVSSIVIKS